ncbi:MAG: hypothetical protein WCJ58_06170 [bacterium]
MIIEKIELPEELSKDIITKSGELGMTPEDFLAHCIEKAIEDPKFEKFINSKIDP